MMLQGTQECQDVTWCDKYWHVMFTPRSIRRLILSWQCLEARRKWTYHLLVAAFSACTTWGLWAVLKPMLQMFSHQKYFEKILWISICVFMNNVWGVWSICWEYCRGGDIDRWYWHWWHHCRGRDELWLWTSGVVASDILNLCIEARRGAFGPFSPSFDINKHLLDCLLNNLPENVHKIVSL